MNKKKKIILFSGIGFFIISVLCFVVVFAVRNKKEAKNQQFLNKGNLTQEESKEEIKDSGFKQDKKNEDLDEKSEFKNPRFVSIECIYKGTDMKADATKEEIVENRTDMLHVVNFYILLSEVFEQEGFFKRKNKELFLNKHIMGNDNLVRLKAETEFLIDGDENLEKFKNILTNKDFKSVDITEEKFKKAVNEIFSYIEKNYKSVKENVVSLRKILSSRNKSQVDRAKRYYEQELEKLNKQEKNGYIYTNADRTQEVFLEKEIDYLKQQDSLTNEQVDDFKESLKSEEDTLKFLQNFIENSSPKNIEYEKIKDLHKDIEVKKTVKDLKDEMKYYAMGR